MAWNGAPARHGLKDREGEAMWQITQALGQSLCRTWVKLRYATPKKCDLMRINVEKLWNMRIKHIKAPHFWLFSRLSRLSFLSPFPPLRDVDSCWADGSAKRSPGTSTGSYPPGLRPSAQCREATDRRRPGVSKASASWGFHLAGTEKNEGVPKKDGV